MPELNSSPFAGFKKNPPLAPEHSEKLPLNSKPPKTPKTRKAQENQKPNAARSENEELPRTGTQARDCESSVVARMAGIAVPDLDAEAAEVFAQGMRACFKGSSTPDVRTRLETLKLYLAYRHGLPVQRMIKITGGVETLEDKLAEVSRTPEGARMLDLLGLARLDDFTKGGGRIAKDHPVTDIGE